MTTPLVLDDLWRARETEDPNLPALMIRMALSPDPEPETPIREGALTFSRFVKEIRSKAFGQKPLEEQARYRMEQIRHLESPEAEVPLPDRLRMHELILDLWTDQSPYARECLLQIIAKIPLVYGPWRALKKIAKEAEEKGDTQVLGALAARFDMALADGRHELSETTLAYLCRRMWRYLRRTGQSFPVAYADTAVDFLAPYRDGTRWHRTWIANHIFHHETGAYSRRRFSISSADFRKHRAFADLWQRSPRPLFSLLERAESEPVRRFATGNLISDFRTGIRDVEPAWVARLVNRQSPSVDKFVIWVLENVPRFEQGAFRELGLHKAVLRLFDSPHEEARDYAAAYALIHARDLPVVELIRLINNNSRVVRKMAAHLLQERDPRKEIGLDAWGRLLETPYGHKLAATVLRKHFGARELTPEWFKQRLLSSDEGTVYFARNQILKVHNAKDLKTGFFMSLIDEMEDTGVVAGNFALKQLEKLGADALDPEFLQRLFVHPIWHDTVCAWIERGVVKPATLPIEFYKTLADPELWAASSWIAELKKSTRWWARQVAFDEDRAQRVLEWFTDSRRFTAADLGFEWLLALIQRGDPSYQRFASELMIKSFTPADFAVAEDAAEKVSPEPEPEIPDQSVDLAVDLDGQSFVFTGKMSIMPRKEAQKKVTGANGKNASTVGPSLDYLVIGDEGSSLYGQGKKGSKQIKAEKLIADGKEIRIISETAFLQMLSGKTVEISSDALEKGCLGLWEMAAAGKSADSLSKFAMLYIRHHHSDICLAETDRPVDPGAEIPPEFLSFERVAPLFFADRQDLRSFALYLAQWEFARWSPPAEELVWLVEADDNEVREFVGRALLAPETPEHRRYRLDMKQLPTDTVYRLCESGVASAREVGMEILGQVPRFQLPEELFRLTQSPDRKIRAFVIRILWSLYRQRGITPNWKPAPPVATSAKTGKKTAEPEEPSGARPRPESPPAKDGALQEFLRRILFEIPPGRPEKDDQSGRLKPLPTRKGKLLLIEVLRDLAVEDKTFAGGILPLLTEFMGSRGKSEFGACLVAVTRIRQAHPSLAEAEAT